MPKISALTLRKIPQRDEHVAASDTSGENNTYKVPIDQLIGNEGNYVESGFDVASTSSLDVTLNSGTAFVDGTRVSRDSQVTVTVADDATSTVYADSNDNITSTTGTPPTDSADIAEVTASAGTIDSTTDKRITKRITAYLRDVLAAKGSLVTLDANDVAVERTVGNDNDLLVGDSGQSSGLNWKTIATVLAAEILTTNQRILYRNSGGSVTQDSIESILQSNILNSNGDILIRDGSGNVVSLGIGTSGQVLGTDGNDPQWENPVDADVTQLTSSSETISVSVESNRTYKVFFQGEGSSGMAASGPSGATFFATEIRYDVANDTIDRVTDYEDLLSSGNISGSDLTKVEGVLVTGGSGGTLTLDAGSGNTIQSESSLAVISAR